MCSLRRHIHVSGRRTNVLEAQYEGLEQADLNIVPCIVRSIMVGACRISVRGLVYASEHKTTDRGGVIDATPLFNWHR